MSAWEAHEDWRKKTPGALQVFMGRSLLIDSLLGEQLPWTIDEYAGVMRRIYQRFGIACPVAICRDFCKYIIPDDYLQQTTQRSIPHTGRGPARNSSVPIRAGSANW